MEAGIIIELVILAVIVIQFVVMLVFRSKNRQGSQDHVMQKLVEYDKRLDKNESAMRDEFSRNFAVNREESNKSAKDIREELAASLKSFEDKFSTNITGFTGLIDQKIASLNEFMGASSKNNRDELNKSILDFQGDVSRNITSFSELLSKELKSVQDTVSNSTRLSREELTKSLKDFEEKFSSKIENLSNDTGKKLEEIRKDNDEKLEKMRLTVDKELHTTLETRLGESFKLVSERLELVQKGLGEMQTLATGVGDLKKVLSNVKTKGVLGEYQLGAILEQLLAPGQYAENVKTKEGSKDNVEFAVKIPSKDDTNKIVWLPIDSKFPTTNYETLLASYDAGDTAEIDKAQKELAKVVKTFAREIREKYIDPPNTTEFAIMFLPFEGLYAEILRIPGLFESMQGEYKITIAGPTTISAFLNSLQMGFRSLAVEKRTSEIWNILGAVRTEFGKFGDILEQTKRKLDQASAELEKTGTRTRQIERKLKDVQTLPEAEAQNLLDLPADSFQ
ncbi:MAG: DNA recombination protein RmuC [Treponema sp.]|jgi:DNA recombination protein RmuC|nr:DNA recombination protein RmuC [Treponema sp.]